MQNKFFILVILAIFGCGLDKAKLPDTLMTNLNRLEWVNDSLGCDGYRMSAVNQIMMEKESLIGLSFMLLEKELLGPGNKKNNSAVAYFVDCAIAPTHDSINEPRKRIDGQTIGRGV